MKYKTHIIISSFYREEKYFYLVQGIEYPNLITEGYTLEEAIKMGIDAWSLLCVVYEDKKVQIKESSNDLDMDEILSKIDYQEYGIAKENSMIVEIESEDTNEYRKECSEQKEDTIMSEKKIYGFEISEIIYSEINNLESNIRNLKYEKNSIKTKMTNRNYIKPTDEVISTKLIALNNNLDSIERYASNILENIIVLRSNINKIYTRTDVVIDDNEESTNETI